MAIDELLMSLQSYRLMLYNLNVTMFVQKKTLYSVCKYKIIKEFVYLES